MKALCTIVLILCFCSSVQSQVRGFSFVSGHAVVGNTTRLIVAQPLAGPMFSAATPSEPGVVWGFMPLVLRPVLSVDGHAADNSVVLAPNPTYDVVHLTHGCSASRVEVVDLTGRVLIDRAISDACTTISIDLRSVSAGSYILVVSGPKGRRTHIITKL